MHIGIRYLKRCSLPLLQYMYVLLSHPENKMRQSLLCLLLQSLGLAFAIFDGIPILSQLQSALQAVFGDFEGARRTQENFLLINGPQKHQPKWAEDYWQNGWTSLIDATPGLGHAKGIVHYATGDKAAGDRAMIDASRTVAQFGGAI